MNNAEINGLIVREQLRYAGSQFVCFCSTTGSRDARTRDDPGYVAVIVSLSAENVRQNLCCIFEAGALQIYTRLIRPLKGGLLVNRENDGRFRTARIESDVQDFIHVSGGRGQLGATGRASIWSDENGRRNPVRYAIPGQEGVTVEAAPADV